MEEKKVLTIDTMICDLRTVSEETLQSYEKIYISAMTVFITERSLAVMFLSISPFFIFFPTFEYFGCFPFMLVFITALFSFSYKVCQSKNSNNYSWR